MIVSLVEDRCSASILVGDYNKKWEGTQKIGDV